MRHIKSLGISIIFPFPPLQSDFQVYILVFSDASRIIYHGQLSYLYRLVVGPFSKDTLFYTLLWTSHNQKRPVKSVGASEIMAASGAI